MQEKAAAVAALQALQPNPDMFRRKGRGYVDWKFSEVCEYLGYPAALEYVHTMHRWYDFETKYRDCELQNTYLRYLEACAQVTTEKK